MSAPGTEKNSLYPVLSLLAILLVCGVLLNILAGAADLSLLDVWAALWHQGSEQAEWVVWELRLPRALLGAVVGIHFGLSGMILQSLTRNPLADAGILGISAGASLMVVLILVFAEPLLAGDKADPYRQMSLAVGVLPVLAMLGGGLAAALVYSISGGGQLTVLKLILTGVTIASVLNALVAGALAMWGHVQTEVIVQWLAGSLYSRGWQHLMVTLPWTLIGLLLCAVVCKPLALLRFNDDQSRSLGLNVQRWRLLALLTATLLAASAVGVVGPVGFIGLLVPHMARWLLPGYLGRQLVLCAMLGALLVMLGDAAGRVLIIPYELPIGVVSALLGVPFFLYLLSRQP